MRKKKTTLLLLGCLSLDGLHAQRDSLALRYAGTITQEELRSHLTVLASDAYMGRDTGREGQKMAARYIRQQFVQAGIPPVPAADPGAIVEGYYQPYDVIEMRAGSIQASTPSGTLTYGKQIAYFNEVLKEDLLVRQLLHIGDASRMPKEGVKGMAVLIDGAQLGSGVEILVNLRERMERMKGMGPELILVSVPDMASLVKGMHLGGARMVLAENAKKSPAREGSAQLIFVDEASIDALLRVTKMAWLRSRRRPKRLAVEMQLKVTDQEQRLTAENVLAYIEGTDRKDEVVVLTAHYDHIGVEDGEVYNGADDDGSGTAAILEIAEAFAQASKDGHGPRRSVLVMPVSGEEKGLLGSRYYSEHPVFPLENTVADLNIDMIGRRDSAHADSPPYVYIIGSDRLSTDLHRANERANEAFADLELDYRYNAEDDPNRFYYRSDHYNFARKGVPSIFYFSGVHEDYHKPGDDVEKIEFGPLHQRTLLVFHTAWILANQEDRITVDKPMKP